MTSSDRDIFNDAKAFRQQVRLAAVQVAALGDAELAAALAYEVEPFSKIPAADADVAWRENAAVSTASVKVYDVAVVRRSPRSCAKSGGGAGRRLSALVAVVAILSVAAVAVDFYAVSSRRRELRRAVAAQEPLDDELHRLEAVERETRDEAHRIREGREREEAAQRRVAAMRSALPDALGCIAAVCGGRIVVREISSPSPFAVEFRCIAATAENASDILARLGEAVPAAGWRLESGSLAANAAGTMAEFSFRIRPSEEQVEVK